MLILNNGIKLFSFALILIGMIVQTPIRGVLLQPFCCLSVKFKPNTTILMDAIQ